MLTLPSVVRDPYRATTERLNAFISVREDIEHPIIIDDIKELEGQVREFERVLSREASQEEFDRLVPYRFLGLTEYSKNNYKKAINYYEKALIQEPNKVNTMGNMVMAYWWTEQFQEALKQSDSMIRCEPKVFLGYFCKGRTLVFLHEIRDAIANFNMALKFTTETSGQRATVFTSRANAHLLNGNWEKALSDSEKSVEINPTNNAPNVNKAIALKN
jgi:tetratricopeptide (TPR) repeat protein